MISETEGFASEVTHGRKNKENSDIVDTYIARLLAFLVLAVLNDPGMRAEHIHDFGATKFTRKVKRSFKALEQRDSRSVSDWKGTVVADSESQQQLTALSGVLR